LETKGKYCCFATAHKSYYNSWIACNSLHEKLCSDYAYCKPCICTPHGKIQHQHSSAFFKILFWKVINSFFSIAHKLHLAWTGISSLKSSSKFLLFPHPPHCYHQQSIFIHTFVILICRTLLSLWWYSRGSIFLFLKTSTFTPGTISASMFAFTWIVAFLFSHLLWEWTKKQVYVFHNYPMETMEAETIRHWMIQQNIFLLWSIFHLDNQFNLYNNIIFFFDTSYFSTWTIFFWFSVFCFLYDYKDQLLHFYLGQLAWMYFILSDKKHFQLSPSTFLSTFLASLATK